MPTDLEFIQGFSPLFAHLHGEVKEKKLESPMGATAYYIFLINNFPTDFKTLSNNAKKAMGDNINDSKLKRGRQDLLEHGFISRVLPVYDDGGKLDFKREAYLPISPKLAWQDNVGNLEGRITPDGLSDRAKLAEELEKIYLKKFGKYGVLAEDDSITIFHSSEWLLYHLARNINGNKSIRMLLGTLGSFQEPTIKYYEKMLNAGLKTKIICDPVTDEVKERIENILNLKQKIKKEYHENIEIKATLISQGTSRRMIYDNMGIDGKKLIFNGDLSYISTIYFQKEVISRMQKNFDRAFKESCEINEFLGGRV